MSCDSDGGETQSGVTGEYLPLSGEKVLLVRRLQELGEKAIGMGYQNTELGVTSRDTIKVQYSSSAYA